MKPAILTDEGFFQKSYNRVDGFGLGYQIRLSFFESYASTKIILKDVTIKNAPFGIVYPFKSSHPTLVGLMEKSHDPNHEGCNPEYTNFEPIHNGGYDTGEECIAIKSGRNEDGRRKQILRENIYLEDIVANKGGKYGG